MGQGVVVDVGVEVGAVGIADSPLRPAGRMKLGDQLLDVVAQGEFIEPGTAIEIVEVFQNRIIVRSAPHRFRV